MRTAGRLLRTPIAACLPLLVGCVLVGHAQAAEVEVSAIAIKPANPGPSTLCELKVELKNRGSRPVSFFSFEVKVDGKDVPLYKETSYVNNIDPGKTGEIQLNNFYTPGEAKLFTVQVALVKAQWVEVKKEGASSTTTPTGVVAGLPANATLTVKMPHASRPVS